MTKISKRLKAIVEFVDKNDSLIDVGCDHGLLSIYLVENKMVKKIIASDINPNALSSATRNIKKRNMNIETVLSDGIHDVNLKGINGLVISGMGTNTILHILSDSNKLKYINKLLIQSNNAHELLRYSLNDKGYYLEKESYTFDKGKWYVTCKFIKSEKKNTSKEIKYGFLDNKEYNAYLVALEKKIYKNIPWISMRSKLKALKRIKMLKKAISETEK